MFVDTLCSASSKETILSCNTYSAVCLKLYETLVSRNNSKMTANMKIVIMKSLEFFFLDKVNFLLR